MSKYKGGMVVITMNNSKLPIANVSSTMIVQCFNPNQVQSEKVLHVLEDVVLPNSKELKDKQPEKLNKEKQDKEDNVQEIADEGPTIDDGE
ncbi:hypothetical protein GH714_015245 [Hevea brasiliensis]|uniref:Uncharacterized protein n=1 Tax=Hevea brasiliensis TaxID=3981 RepID=A0A6A6L8X0_HEVBR|nr:hypothetical protein GH714_015245 [Hevea brasiliensis]